jgi:hypothetical protein
VWQALSSNRELHCTAQCATLLAWLAMEVAISWVGDCSSLTLLLAAVDDAVTLQCRPAAASIPDCVQTVA